MYTIGRLAKEFGLSRSTLLYYDSIGLLKSGRRTNTRYRLYGEKEYERLEQICRFREIGLPLKGIKKLLRKLDDEASAILRSHLTALSEQIKVLRKQQFAIVELLKKESGLKNIPVINKEQWVELLSSTGLSEEDMHRWHIEFERLSPQGHHDFLASLGIEENEIKQIRDWAKK